MRFYGLIGYPLGHSFSVPYFRNKFEKEGIEDALYSAFPLPSVEDFPILLKKERGLVGLNVTIPYKESIIPYLSELDETAKAIGAVNTLLIKDKGIKGYNTDCIGFEKSLLPLLAGKPYNALILGTGGAAKAVAFVLNKLGCSFRYISRNPQPGEWAYGDLNQEIIKENQLIINCSPMGMHPHIESFPEIPYEFLNADSILYDLIYNPEETIFLKKGKEAGAKTKNGLEMLYLQAEAAWSIWNQ